MSAPVVIVTGGGSGIGRAACTQLGARGARVLVVDRDLPGAEETARLTREAGGEAVAHAADVSDDAQVAGYVHACEERFGGVDAFFNNAGIEGPIAAIPDYPLEDFEQVFRVNVTGVFLGLKHVIPALRRRGGGAIVNTSSQAGLRGVGSLSGYSASKHAVIGLSRAAALETAAEGIRVNTICPGPTSTRMMKDIATAVRSAGGDPDSFVARIPAGRLGEAGEIAAAAVFLLLDAPAFLTGAEVPVDGGMTTP
jgi:NAD(P)-dependent dehydrogenase (short-subunit alcohol dehydrogenase family)